MLRHSTYIGKTLLDRYQIQRLLGEGGMGQVLLAFDNQSREEKAIKLIDVRKKKYPLETVLRFQAEAQALKELQHPFIIHYEDFFHEDDVYMLVMEYIDAPNLAHFVKDHHPLDLGIVLKIFMDLTDALVFIHEKNWVHFDLKTANILIRHTRNGLDVKLLDFGLSHLVTGQMEHMGGTLAYMAPEQTGILHRPVDHRADLYSLGICMYEILTGKVPFEHEDAALLIHQHMAQEPEPVTQFRPDVPVILENIILKLLSKDPDDRYRTTQGLLKDIQRYVRLAETQAPHSIHFKLGEEDHSWSIPRQYPLVGREQEIKTVMEYRDQALRLGSGQMLLVEGAPRVGKTRFVSELFNQLSTTEKICWHVQLRQDSREKPMHFFKTLLGQFDVFLKSMTPAQQMTIVQYFIKSFDTRFPLLLEIVPELENWLEPGMIPVSRTVNPWKIEDYREVVYQFIEITARYNHFLVIMVDDLQHMDAQSFQCLFGDLKRFLQLKVLWIITFNYKQLAKEFKQTLSLLDLPTLRHMFLNPLSEAQFGLLLQRVFSQKLQDMTFLMNRLYNLVHGNPGLLSQILQQLVDHHAVYYQHNSWRVDREQTERLMGEVESAKAGSLELLLFTPEEQKVLQCGAVFIRAFTFEALLRIIPAHPELQPLQNNELLEILDKAIQNNVLMVDSKKLYAFRDTQLRESLASSLVPEHKARLHQEIALFLEQRILPDSPDSIYDIAFHWAKSGNNEQAFEAYFKSAMLTHDERTYQRQTNIYFNLAVEYLNSLPEGLIPADRQFDVRYEAIRYNFLYTQEFDKLWQETLALEKWAGHNKVQLMKLLWLKALLSFFRGFKQDTFRFGEELIHMATEPEDEQYLTRILNILGRIASGKSYAERSDLLIRGMELSFKYQIYNEVVSNMIILSSLMSYQGRFRELEATIHQIADRLNTENTGLGETLRIAAQAIMEMERGEFRKILEMVNSEYTGMMTGLMGPMGDAIEKCLIARALGMNGKLSDAIQRFEEILNRTEKAEQQIDRPMALYGRIQVAVFNDDPETALKFLDEAKIQMDFRPDPYMQGLYACMAGWAYMNLNFFDKAGEALEEARSFSKPLDAPLLELQVQFAVQRLAWFKEHQPSAVKTAEQILTEMLRLDITGYYELFRDDLKTWSKHTSESSTSLTSFLQGNTDMFKLMEINRKISAQLDIQSLFEEVLKGAMQMSGAEQGYLFTVGRCCQVTGLCSEDDVMLRLARNARGTRLEPKDHRFSKVLIREVFESRQSIVTRDARHEKRWNKSDSIRSFQLRSILAVPIMLKDTMQGVLYLENHHASSVFSMKDREIVEVFATQVSIAMNNAQIYAQEQQARQQTEATMRVFERFVPRQFTNRLGNIDIESLETGLARQTTLSVLFSDVRSFTSLTEDMPPEEVFRFLNEYLKFMEAPIREHHGFVDKFIGDAIMALFDDNPGDAVYAALGMQSALAQFNVIRQQRGAVPLRIGIGINTGEVTIGVIGSEERMDTTVLGDAVNTASRIESLTKLYGCDLIISEQTKNFLGNQHTLPMRLIDSVQVKGKEAVTRLYDVFEHDRPELKEAKQKHLPSFQEAVRIYEAGKWKEAQACFRNYQELLPEDPVPQVFIDRCETFLKLPPAQWNGVYRIDKK
ncbi:MAG: protein kinase [SAR324 cluster bacterium]|nr:protein kinase [SAR324 cluster bacterium]